MSDIDRSNDPVVHPSQGEMLEISTKKFITPPPGTNLVGEGTEHTFRDHEMRGANNKEEAKIEKATLFVDKEGHWELTFRLNVQVTEGALEYLIEAHSKQGTRLFEIHTQELRAQKGTKEHRERGKSSKLRTDYNMIDKWSLLPRFRVVKK